MALDQVAGLAAGAVFLGALHGVEPGHGWPVAASYALGRTNIWLAGLLSGAIIGVGHLVSSIAMVVAFFWAKSAFGLTDVGWMSYVAGALLILLGLREYRQYRLGEGHSHGHAGGHSPGDENGHGHEHGEHHTHEHGEGHVHHHGEGHVHHHGEDHVHDHGEGHTHEDEEGHTHDHGEGHALEDEEGHAHEHGEGHSHDHGHDGSVIARLLALLPFDLGPDQHGPTEAADRGLVGITAFAFALGFAHEEEFEIIALCIGSDYCLELMLLYALTVVLTIVAFTLLLVAGYEHFEERAEAYADRLPLFSAVVLVAMGLGFLLGVF